MTDSLVTLFKAIANSPNEQTLEQEVIPQIGAYFSAKRCRLFLINQLPAKISDFGKQALSREHNPVLNYLWEHHAPVHENILLSASKWQGICPRFDHGHVMAGPIVANGSLIGGLGVTRDRFTPAFSQQNITDMSGLCLHISTFLLQKQLSAVESNSAEIKLLTPREIAIAKLVAQGLTNAEIGKKLWIQENSVKQALKRMFRKLNISSRTSLVALLLQ
ncbi:helix-turn-helix transcriptional regulator [Pleurocapsa sp. CCALA 161]|uniref:LuxR C-terminal-related transcriptional regulator n=1 Tax=Pleurocapsa sp. CCALA 161 TaxID=2107688 RepID=UPI000D073373|nr:LuxR C-terminal-related transcriptional regulator [Pleurocapsa sp. CCALA 161]PSB06824.1 helix-turn-helix transcriptional regulator [Pleurocapsa sp. CCALA 161]